MAYDVCVCMVYDVCVCMVYDVCVCMVYDMGANHFLKQGGLELDSRRARTFFKAPPVHIQAPPIFGGLDINWGA